VSLTTTATRYRRARGVLTRDTDLHVVVLPTAPRADFVLLGGGAAAIWRILETPLTADQIAERFDRTSSPEEAELISYLHDLVTRGVLDLEDPP
jgi:hypothetical protein